MDFNKTIADYQLPNGCIDGQSVEVKELDFQLQYFGTSIIDECFSANAKCKDWCQEKYGGTFNQATGEPSWYCAKGCGIVGSGGDLITHESHFCSEDPSERFTLCMEGCKSASSDGSNRNYCRYGCIFWGQQSNSQLRTLKKIQQWSIHEKGMSIESNNCEKNAITAGIDGSLTLRETESSSPSQQFTIISSDAILRPAQGNHTQKMEFHFVEPPYSFAVLPGELVAY